MYRIFLVACSFILLSSCEESVQGNGNVKSETRETAPFSKIEVSGAYTVNIEPANYSSLTIEADENLLQYIETYVDNGELKVSSNKNFSRYRKLQLNITVKDFEGLKASGASELRSKSTLTGNEVDLDFSGAVEAQLAINTTKLDGDFSGACEVVLRGNANEARFETSGAVEIDAEEFKVQKCRLNMSGAGQAVVYVTEELDVDVSGAAEIRYRGNPGNVEQNISGAASVKPL